jgi:hypothetical protein
MRGDGGGIDERRSEMTFGDFGAPVSVSAPPASEAYVPLSGLAGRHTFPEVEPLLMPNDSELEPR